jgi:hypothetical protein
MYRKNTASQGVGFAAIAISSGETMTGTTGFAAYRVLDGGAQASATGSVADKGNGQYWFALSQADTNANEGSYLFTMTGMIAVEKTLVFTACDPTTASNFGITNIDATVSSRSTYAGGAVASVTGAVGSVTGSVGSVTGAVGSVTGNVGGNVAGSVASVTDPVTVGTNNDKTAYELDSAGLDQVVAETGINARQALALILDAVASVLSGATGGASTITIKNPANSATRISATVDANGNRTAVTLNPPA